MIAGTIRNSVKMAALDNQWQQKKSSGALFKKGDGAELTREERELARFKEQAEDIRKSRERADLDAKLKSGKELTAEEIEYLRRNDPQALKEYEELQRERKAYKEALKNCDSKEEVEELKMTKLGQFAAQARKVSNNPNIPKGEKKAQMEKLMRLMACVQDEHLAFVKTLRYQELPERKQDADKGKKGRAEELSGKKPGTEQTITGEEVLGEAPEEPLQEAFPGNISERDAVRGGTQKAAGQGTAIGTAIAGAIAEADVCGETAGILLDVQL